MCICSLFLPVWEIFTNVITTYLFFQNWLSGSTLFWRIIHADANRCEVIDVICLNNLLFRHMTSITSINGQCSVIARDEASECNFRKAQCSPNFSFSDVLNITSTGKKLCLMLEIVFNCG